MILEKLREQRESLKRLAVQHLPSNQIARFDWSAESILDTEAGEISSMLEGCNIYVPGILRVSPDWRSVFLNGAGRGTSVELLDLIWEAGFQHPDTDDVFGPDHHHPFFKTLPEVDEEEILELLEEDGLLLKVLENLMDDFSVEFPRLGCGLHEFFEGYWIQIVREKLDQSDAATLTEQQLKEAEDTGVTWDLGFTADDTSDMEYESDDDGRTTEQETFEYWERAIDEI
ncbi:hypothetical protein E8E14_002300 [Neopestalotiopsis sp. 37M]|nr:hypothetical protein E8E14_002300 [Neopestalotiopsis sp. 37M]